MSQLKEGKDDLRTTLDKINIGEQGVIEDYAEVSDLQGRLKELGLVRGTIVSVERYAPFGDPIEIQVRGYHLAIRRKDASHIIVSRLKAMEKK